MLADFPPRDPGKKEELNQMFWNKLLDLPGPKAPNPNDTPESKFVSPLLWGNIEIQATCFTICKVRQFFSFTYLSNACALT